MEPFFFKAVVGWIVATAALRDLYDAESHVMGCAFTGCSCGAVQRRAEARAAAAKVLRGAAA